MKSWWATIMSHQSMCGFTCQLLLHSKYFIYLNHQMSWLCVSVCVCVCVGYMRLLLGCVLANDVMLSHLHTHQAAMLHLIACTHSQQDGLLWCTVRLSRVQTAGSNVSKIQWDLVTPIGKVADCSVSPTTDVQQRGTGGAKSFWTFAIAPCQDVSNVCVYLPIALEVQTTFVVDKFILNLVTCKNLWEQVSAEQSSLGRCFWSKCLIPTADYCGNTVGQDGGLSGKRPASYIKH